MDRIPERIDSTFRFVLLAARRAEQLIQGAPAKVEQTHAKPTRVAVQEIQRDLVSWDYGPPPVEEVPPSEAPSAEPPAEI
ncbi:MAG: DNA-directed RNA polymerase subunit omega [Holophagales bacterium]|jgi:DNA-directed RNA polymerase omega subunit|nr:MAG: DNA-directed RNA polymerase subunit omega [Holophagales bacterium]